MKIKSIYLKSYVTKTGRCFTALLLACIMIFSISACGGQKTTSEEIKPISVEREEEPLALQTANEATVIALRQYIYARLATEAFLSVDASSMSIEELSAMANEVLLAWENAETVSSSAVNVTDRAILLLDTPAAKQSLNINGTQASFMPLAAVGSLFQNVAYAAEGGRKIDPQTWAENLTKQYDALSGAKRYQQLAQQLGTDAKSAYEQMVLAQKIIRNAAELEEAEGVVKAWTESINYLQGVKTASKVGVFVVGTVVTGGGSVSALGASSMSLGQAGGIVVGGTDCIVDIAATGSNIILGENHQVTVGFNDLKDKLAPVSAVVGLATFNAGETGEQLTYIGDTLTDWFFEGKILGVKVDKRNVSARVFDSVGGVSMESALEKAGYVFPEATKTLKEIMDALQYDPEEAIAKMDAIVSQMAELERMVEGWVEAENDQSTSAENSLGNASIFGTYTCTFVYNGSEDEGEDVETIMIQDKGDGTVGWIDEDGEETILTYNKNMGTLHWDEDGFTIYIAFSGTGNTLTGSGYMKGVLWDEPLNVNISLTKISH